MPGSQLKLPPRPTPEPMDSMEAAAKPEGVNIKQTCKDLMKDLIKKEYSTYFGSDGRSEIAILHHAKLALIVNIVGRLSMKFKGNISRV